VAVITTALKKRIKHSCCINDERHPNPLSIRLFHSNCRPAQVRVARRGAAAAFFDQSAAPQSYVDDELGAAAAALRE
jgi:hypothetical protein